VHCGTRLFPNRAWVQRLKLYISIIFAAAAVCCSAAQPAAVRYSIANSKEYGASLFRQNCVICHGPEGEGRTLDTGLVVPNMREGPLLKKQTREDIRQQISDGGNGMPPFRLMLSQREIDLMTDFVVKVRSGG